MRPCGAIWRCWRGVLVLLGAVALLGCAPSQLEVANAELGSGGGTFLFFAYANDEREVYTTEDEKVTFAVRLGYNLVGYYTPFRVHWVAPTGATYLDARALTAWGQHQALVAELPIRGTPATRLTGTWQVRLVQGERVLTEKSFDLVDARYTTLAQAQAIREMAAAEPGAEPFGPLGEAAAAAEAESAATDVAVPGTSVVTFGPATDSIRERLTDADLYGGVAAGDAAFVGAGEGAGSAARPADSAVPDSIASTEVGAAARDVSGEPDPPQVADANGESQAPKIADTNGESELPEAQTETTEAGEAGEGIVIDGRRILWAEIQFGPAQAPEQPESDGS